MSAGATDGSSAYRLDRFGTKIVRANVPTNQIATEDQHASDSSRHRRTPPGHQMRDDQDDDRERARPVQILERVGNERARCQHELGTTSGAVIGVMAAVCARSAK